MVTLSAATKSAFPKAKFGYMVADGLDTPAMRPELDKLIASEIDELRASYPDYDRKTALKAEPLCHYTAYYKRHQKSYHVLGQLESILLKGKGIPPVEPAVACMFLAEVKSLLLTAGHDLDRIDGDLIVEVADQEDFYTGLSGREQPLVQGDLYLRDAKGVLSSILGGPDARTKLTSGSRSALYFVYGAEGVTADAIEQHLQTIYTYLAQAIPGASIRSMQVL